MGDEGVLGRKASVGGIRGCPFSKISMGRVPGSAEPGPALVTVFQTPGAEFCFPVVGLMEAPLAEAGNSGPTSLISEAPCVWR